MKKEKMKFRYESSDIVVSYNYITIALDVSELWDYVVANGYHEWHENGFDPSTKYGHTQRTGTHDFDYFIDHCVDADLLIEFIEHQLSL